MNVNQVLNEVESIIKPMQRSDVMPTPEECRLYEQYSVEQAQAMARIRPVASTENADQDYIINPVLGKMPPITEEQKDYLSQYLKG